MPQTVSHAPTQLRVQVNHALRLERSAFGAKVRAARAVLELSQDQFAGEIGLTQKSVHRLEQGSVEPRRRTILTVERFWNEHGISFENLPDGGFRLAVKGSLLHG